MCIYVYIYIIYIYNVKNISVYIFTLDTLTLRCRGQIHVQFSGIKITYVSAPPSRRRGSPLFASAIILPVAVLRPLSSLCRVRKNRAIGP